MEGQVLQSGLYLEGTSNTLLQIQPPCHLHPARTQKKNQKTKKDYKEISKNHVLNHIPSQKEKKSYCLLLRVGKYLLFIIDGGGGIYTY